MTAEGLAIAPAAEEDCWAHFVVIQVIQNTDPPGRGLPVQAGRDFLIEWQAACARLTARVEHLSPSRALLDLGTCTDVEALGAVQGLLAHLATRDIPVRSGIAPTGCLAELALLRAPAHIAVRLISPDEAAELLYRTPVDILPRLHVAGIAREISSDVVERLHGYGLRTLGQVGRLGELALRRQFGAQIGSVLAAIAVGRDPRPLSPTPPPASLRVRLRISADAVKPEQVPAVLAYFAEQVAEHLHVLGRQIRTLQLAVSWEAGAQQTAMHTLQQPTNDLALLLDALQRLLLPLVAPGRSLADLHLTLLDFAPVAPEQATFWRTRPQRTAALGAIADTLMRRHGMPILLSPHLVAPDAVFPEERHALIAAGISCTGITGSTGSTGSTMAPTRPDAEQHLPCGTSSKDVWQDVPQHLHWW